MRPLRTGDPGEAEEGREAVLLPLPAAIGPTSGLGPVAPIDVVIDSIPITPVPLAQLGEGAVFTDVSGNVCVKGYLGFYGPGWLSNDLIRQATEGGNSEGLFLTTSLNDHSFGMVEVRNGAELVTLASSCKVLVTIFEKQETPDAQP